MGLPLAKVLQGVEGPAAGLPQRLGFGAGVIAVAALLGWELRSDVPVELAANLFALGFALAIPLPITLIGDLYHHPVHAKTLTWPLSSQQHLALGSRLAIRRFGPWLIALTVLSGFAGSALPAKAMALTVAFGGSAAAGALLIAFGVSGLCAFAADANGALISQLRGALAGPFTSQRHAPFLYLPALAFALIVVALSLAEQGLVLCLVSGALPPRGLLLLAAPIALGIVVAALGRYSYLSAGLRVIAWVQQEARTIYGGKPAPVDPPYGIGLTRLLRPLTATFFAKALREQGRIERTLWPTVGLGIAAAGLYAINAGDALTAAPLIAALLVIWIGLLPLRQRPNQLGFILLATLPVHPSAYGWGRFWAIVFAGSHLVAALAAALGLRHGMAPAVAVVTLFFAVAAVAVLVTGPKWARGPHRWVPRTAWLPAAAVLGALAQSAHHWFAAAGAVAVAAIALITLSMDRRHA